MIEFREWLGRGTVLAHVGGASGSGKTTLVDRINRQCKGVVAKDLDDFDAAAVALLGWGRVPKADFTDPMLADLASRRQGLLRDWLGKQAKPVVLAGHHVEGEYRLRFGTKHRFYLDVDPKVCARRQWERGGDREGDPVAKKNLPGLERAAAREIRVLRLAGYLPRTEREILAWVKLHENA